MADQTTAEIQRNVYAFLEHINTELNENDGLLPVSYGRSLTMSETSRFFILRGTAVAEYQDKGHVFLRVCKQTGNILPSRGESVLSSVLCRQQSRLIEWNDCIYSHHALI